MATNTDLKLGEEFEIGSDQEIILGNEGLAIKNSHVVYEHDPDHQATVFYATLQKGSETGEIVATIPGQAVWKSYLITLCGETQGRVILRIDKPSMGEPFELEIQQTVVIEDLKIKVSAVQDKTKTASLGKNVAA